jgi:hypothetical protein
MSTSAESRTARFIAVVGAILMLIDSLWGGIAVLPFDWSRITDLTIGIGLVLGLPTYVLDLWSKTRIVMFLPALFLFRWVAGSFASTPPSFGGEPWRGSVLLITSALLLQWSKLQTPVRDAA